MKKMYECHGHIMMDGIDFTQARIRHENAVDTDRVKRELKALSDAGVVYFRDGGDKYGVSEYAKSLAPDYGIKYVTPLFAIHKKGRYGSIVGRGCFDIGDYRGLVDDVRREGGDFIKIMISGIITFRKYGELSCLSLTKEEIKDFIDIAHGEGFPVMVHVNGDDAIRAAVLAGADSIEHGVFMDEETTDILAGSGTVWVPTAAAVAAFTLRNDVDHSTAEKTLRNHLERIRMASEKGALIAAGSDSGAVGVPHGTGTSEEYRLLREAGVTAKNIESGNRKIESIFMK